MVVEIRPFLLNFDFIFFRRLCYNKFIAERELIKQIITVRHKKFATGLFWQPLGVGNTAANYAKHLAKTNGQRYTLFIGYKSMVGLTNGRDGARAGMPSAAVEIINSLSELISFLGVFQIDRYFYLIAVRNGVIIRDILVENADIARKMFVQLAEIPDWGALFAPSSWGIPKSQEKSLEDLIGKTVTAKLHQISVVKSIMPSVFLTILFIVLGFYFLSNQKIDTTPKVAQIDPATVEEYKRQIEEKQQQQIVDENLMSETEVEVFEYPYDRLPNVVERAELCYKAIGFVMQPLMGWNQSYIKCDDEFVSATFVRDFGTLNDFYEIGAELMPGAQVQQISENEILVRVKLPELQTYSSLDERDQETLIRDITTVFQQINMKANIQGVIDTIDNGSVKEDLHVTEISAESKLIPSEFVRAFNGFGGVYMTSIAWRANTRTWNYETIIYSK